MTGWLWWLVIFGIAWNALFGVADYVLSYMREPTYMAIKAAFLNLSSEELIFYYEGWPEWARIAWVMNALGGLGGSVLLAIRDRYAVWLFAVSLIGLAGLTYLFHYAPFPRVAGDPWAGSIDMMRMGMSVVSFAHSIAVIVAVHRFMPTAAVR